MKRTVLRSRYYNEEDALPILLIITLVRGFDIVSILFPQCVFDKLYRERLFLWKS